VVDSAVLRAPRAVTHFSPGSHAARPAQQTGIANLWLAGDWVKGVPHGANGLSQARARESHSYNSPLASRPAACAHWSCGHAVMRPQHVRHINGRPQLHACIRRAHARCAHVRRPGRACVQERAYVTGLRAANLAVQRLGRGRPAPIIDTEPDELHIAAAKQVNRSLRRSQQALVPALNRASRRVRRSLQTLGLP